MTAAAVTPGRIAALLVIAAAVAGLVVLHFVLAGDQVSVPAGAKAGDLVLERCDYETERGGYAADCGTLVVPENRADPQSRLIALPVTRIRARSSRPGTALFRLEGGPGLSNMSFAKASRFADGRDVVLVGYRGVDGSVELDCPEVTSSRSHAREFLTDASFRADAAAFEACARRLRDEGVDLAGYTLPERVDDLEAARRALGYERVDLLSESAGTRTALIYAWRYPDRIRRSVMIGVNPPGAFLWDAATTGEQIGRYAALCARDEACRSRTPDLATSLHLAFERIPERWWFLPIRGGNVRAAAFWGLMNATTDGGGPLNGPMTIDTLLSAGQGDGSGAWLLSVAAELLFPDAQVWGDAAAVSRADAAYARRFFASHANRGSTIGSPGTDLLWAGGRLLDAWPASPGEDEYARVRDSDVETLLIGGALDFATPPQKASRELLPHLSNGRQVVLPGLGHSDDFWAYEPEAGTRLIDAFLEDGRVDRSLYTGNMVDFTPTIGHGAIADIVLAVMLGLAALTAASLLWMAAHVRRRRFGPKAGAALRSVYLVVLGLGGWFVGVIVVLAALPGVAVDDQLLAALSVGLPVGLGVYLAWVDRDWSARTKAIGLIAAVGGALIGARTGFNDVEGPVAALGTAILGAVAGGNLLVLALDIAWDGKAYERSAREVPAARPVTG